MRQYSAYKIHSIDIKNYRNKEDHRKYIINPLILKMKETEVSPQLPDE